MRSAALLGGAVVREQQARLARRLVGRPVPRLSMRTFAGARIRLPEELSSACVVYVYPAAVWSPDGGQESLAADGAQHRAFDRHRGDLQAYGLIAVGVSSEPERAQRTRALEHGVGHDLWSDPELLLAAALGLPTFTHAGVVCYRRLTLILCGRRVERAFYPVETPARSAAQVICWLRASGSPRLPVACA